MQVQHSYLKKQYSQSLLILTSIIIIGLAFYIYIYIYIWKKRVITIKLLVQHSYFKNQYSQSLLLIILTLIDWLILTGHKFIPSSSTTDSMDFPDSHSLHHPYHLSLPAGLPNYNPCLHRDDVSKFLLVGQHWLICVVVHRRTSLRNVSLLLQQCPACFVCFTRMVSEMRCKRPYSCCYREISRICSK